ncbi:MAG TPA: DUF1223 domain-containing protein [Beijerinckiaceae bacterium]
MIDVAAPTTRRVRGSLAAALAALLLLAASGAQTAAQTAAQTPPQTPPRPVVLELFTSQGCSSCPPADKAVAELAREPHVIAVTLPVDYWDYVGWKDTLALPAHSHRQRHYAKSRGDGHVYTPQVVVDGIAHVVGSDAEAISKAAQECYGRNGALSVPMTVRSENGGLRVEIAAAVAGAPRGGGVWLIPVARRASVTVGRGENSGRVLDYVNVSRGLVKIGEWTGEPGVFVATRAQLAAPGADGWVVLLQAGTPGRPGAVLAAAKSP